MDMSQLQFVLADTNVTPDTGMHSASNTITHAGPGVRAAAASAAQALLGLASTQLGVPAAQLSVSKGVVSGGGKSVTYGELIGGKLFNVRMPASYNMDRTSIFPGFVGGIQPGQSPAKAPEPVQAGRHLAAEDRHPGDRHREGGLHPEHPAARDAARADRAAARPVGVRVRRSDRLGRRGLDQAHPRRPRSCARRTSSASSRRRSTTAIQAAAQLKVKWADPPAVLPSGGNEFKHMRGLDTAGKAVMSRADLAAWRRATSATSMRRLPRRRTSSRRATAGRRTSTRRSARSAPSPT